MVSWDSLTLSSRTLSHLNGKKSRCVFLTTGIILPVSVGGLFVVG